MQLQLLLFKRPLFSTGLVRVLYFPLCLNFDSCLALQHVGFDVAAFDCDDFGEWRFRETLRQEHAADMLVELW